VNTAISRMQFLRGDFSGQIAPVRPPWSCAEHTFTQLCNQCGKCIEQCPTDIIKTGRGGYPVIEFHSGECLFCDDCATACETGAIKKIDVVPAWDIRASIDTNLCLTYQKVECFSCSDPCETRAIKMTPQPGGISIPTLITAQCTGCGACYAVCPVTAININSLTREAL